MIARQCGSCGGFCGGGYTRKNGRYVFCKAENISTYPLIDVEYNSKIPLNSYPLFLIIEKLKQNGFDSEKHTMLIEVMNNKPSIYFRCTWVDKK